MDSARRSPWKSRLRSSAPIRKENALKSLVVGISMLALAGPFVACGQSDTQAAQRQNLDRVVPRLPNGLSIAEVEARLGPPQDQIEAEDSEIVLSYGLWEVVFHPTLYKRTRSYREGYWPAGKEIAPLDRQVRELKLGIPRATVERKLGKTEAWQVLSFGSNERLWYGNGRWKLHFKNRQLSGKTLYS